MLTPFGKAVRKHRIDHALTLKEMADSLSISSAFLSAVETGRKSPNESLVIAIGNYLQLNPADMQQLQQAAAESQRDLRINLDGMPDDRRHLATAFARRFPELENGEISELLDVLRKQQQKRDEQ